MTSRRTRHIRSRIRPAGIHGCVCPSGRHACSLGVFRFIPASRERLRPVRSNQATSDNIFGCSENPRILAPCGVLQLLSVPAIISGGAGAWRSRGSRDAMPKPVSHTRPASSTSAFSGLTSFWIRPRWWAWPSAVARLMARPRKRERERVLPVPLQNEVERLTARVGENKDCPPFVTRQSQRLGRPCGLKFG